MLRLFFCSLVGKYCCPCGLLGPGQVAEHCAPGQEVQTQSGSWLVSHGQGADLSRPGTGLGTISVLSCPGLCRGGQQSLLGPESTGGQPRGGPRAPFLQVLLGEHLVAPPTLPEKKAFSCHSSNDPFRLSKTQIQDAQKPQVSSGPFWVTTGILPSPLWLRPRQDAPHCTRPPNSKRCCREQVHWPRQPSSPPLP